MKYYVVMFLLLAMTFIINSGCNNSLNDDAKNSKLKLWYDEPADKWTEALPIGNGRLGAMVFGGISRERIQINEESLWAGSQINNNNPKASEYLITIQQLLLDGKNRKARELADKYLLGTPPRIRSYQTLGDLILNFNIDSSDVKNFSRDLNLSSGIASVRYQSRQNNFRREIFASAVDDVIILRLISENDAGLNFDVELTRDHDAQIGLMADNTILLDGQINDEDDELRGPGGKHMKFASVVKVLHEGGSLSSESNKILVSDADEVVIIISAATDYDINQLNFSRSIDPVEKCEEILLAAEKKSIDKLKEDHINDHIEIFNRVELKLGDQLISSVPTDTRLQRVKDGNRDDDLIALYFQYGRYLLMNSSRSPGVLPANLQGIWNEHFEAPWNSDFHTNINLQMNYWPANISNLDETVLPLTNFFTGLLKPGRLTAKEMYNARGWMMHHVTDPFGRTGLMDGVGWGTSPLAGAWMTQSFWRHFQFTQDEQYLREQAYPIMKEAAQFILDFLIEDEDGNLVTAPSISPENAFIHPVSGKKTWMSYAATIDIQIINELFKSSIEAADILRIDDDFKLELEKTLEKLPPVLIGENGTVREWIKDYEEAEPGHRHMSHLFGLHPGTKITPETPELFEAARKTIEYRLSSGGGHTGWSRAWIINFYARLLDGEKAYDHLSALLQKSTLPNLFDSHPPFQIDGNFGGTAGICEMLLQSHNNKILILPALPKAWKEGYIKGLKAMGNFVIDIKWKDSKLVQLDVTSLSGKNLKIQYESKTIDLNTENNGEYLFNEKLEIQ